MLLLLLLLLELLLLVLVLGSEEVGRGRQSTVGRRGASRAIFRTSVAGRGERAVGSNMLQVMGVGRSVDVPVAGRVIVGRPIAYQGRQLERLARSRSLGHGRSCGRSSIAVVRLAESRELLLVTGDGLGVLVDGVSGLLGRSSRTGLTVAPAQTFRLELVSVVRRPAVLHRRALALLASTR